MNLTENSDEIFMKHVPVGKWVIGGILTFIFGGFCIWLIASAIIKPQWLFEAAPKGWLEMLPITVFAATLILISVFEISFVSMIFAPLTTVSINGKTESIDIIRQRFYGKKAERFYFYQIQKFKSYKGKVKFSSKYFLALVLANQKVIKLNIPIGGDKQNAIKFVKKLNKFIKSERNPDQLPDN